MEEKKEENTVKKNFDFVDTIRCISMMGIVFEHCAAVRTGIYSSIFDSTVEVSLIQSFKFSTIAFFLIGGFLINHKFQEYTAKEYLKNRFKSTIRPWLFWLLVYVALMMIDRYVSYLRGGDDAVVTNFLGSAWNQFVFGVCYTSSWFVLNFLLCICILLIFKRYLYSWWFGGVLGVVSLVYSFNLYYNWFVTNHSMALFGFIFYLWLGVILNRYFDKVMSYIRGVSWPVMILSAIGLFALAIMESFELRSLGSEDAYNTLRISNILYSFVMFALLLKMGSIEVLQKKMKPRQTTFGIYLIHYILIVRLLPLIFQPLRLDYLNYSVWVNSSIHVARFLIVYGLSFWFVTLIRKTRFNWVVGG